MPTVVAITSVLMNKNSSDIYNIYVVTNNLSEKSIAVLKQMDTEDSRVIVLKVSDIEKYEKFTQIDHITSTSLIKFELPNLLPTDLEKVLYLANYKKEGICYGI